MLLYNYGGFVVVAIERQLLHSLAPGSNPGYVITLIHSGVDRGQVQTPSYVELYTSDFFFQKWILRTALGKKK